MLAAEIAERREKAGTKDGCAAGGEDREVEDKGRRSFLRHVEGLGEYNTRGTRCQCLCCGIFE